MAKHTTLSGLFTDIATSLRGKTGSTGKIVADDFPSVIDGIQVGITPSGTKSITTNGSHDVTNYATAKVEVPASGITPSGSIEIKENGTYDVTNYATAEVAVPTSAQVSVVRTVTVASDVKGAPTLYKLLQNDDFIKAHYNHDGFSATLICLTPVACGTNVIHWGYHGNRNIGSSNVSRTGIGFRSTNTSTVASQILTTKISGTGYGQHMRVDSSGNLIQYLHTDYVLPAGTYQIVLTVAG